jgi:hypothetical protein
MIGAVEVPYAISPAWLEGWQAHAAGWPLYPGHTQPYQVGWLKRESLRMGMLQILRDVQARLTALEPMPAQTAEIEQRLDRIDARLARIDRDLLGVQRDVAKAVHEATSARTDVLDVLGRLPPETR